MTQERRAVKQTTLRKVLITAYMAYLLLLLVIPWLITESAGGTLVFFAVGGLLGYLLLDSLEGRITRIIHKWQQIGATWVELALITVAVALVVLILYNFVA